jgi:hypothetical protein
MNSPDLFSRQPLFTELKPGAITLPVPVREEAVQLNTPLTHVMKSLLIVKEPPVIRISREDGLLLQVEEVVRDRNWRVQRKPAFASPIEEMILRGIGEYVWSFADTRDLRVSNPEVIDSFLGFVGYHALRRKSQQLGEDQPTAAELLRRLDQPGEKH